MYIFIKNIFNGWDDLKNVFILKKFTGKIKGTKGTGVTTLLNQGF
jgi:hypothetical protein